ncbi:16S rRNA (guanine(966)-N(2))-methyltransferase RsmD [Lentilactobacillus sp. Marseille-Q4993]|uniref:16S rRNA (guanine(966)-N(2))-methyltransferase RsmD n=1 Tax=Lentilactobacillus sp. Marseille-Q4993 TaxID=3039492 RepID=UPI0024BC48D7|nr:16S rRNA (guanine(966)-N(2))-methyltransferase RsmD [Lentilactobacillus sp. Marseille-Q4993]
MRVISGKYGGIRLNQVKGDQTRPTTDKVKESLFNIVGPYFDGGVFLDLYAGSGAVGIEAVSRGMEKAVLIDKAYPAIATIKENLTKIHDDQSFKVIKGAATNVLSQLATSGEKFDMVFLDPPYKKQQNVADIEKLLELDLLSADSIVISETDNTVDHPDSIGPLKLGQKKNYGLTNVAIYHFE